MSTNRMNRILNHALAIGALFACALTAPWWGTIIVAGVLEAIFKFKVRWLSLYAFAAWFAAVAVRDATNEYGPSRVFFKLFQLVRLGIQIDSSQARLTVYAIVALTGMLLGGLSASIVKRCQVRY